MFVRATWIQSAPERLDERISDYPKTMSGFEALDGYLGAALLVNRSTGAGASISYWATAEAMQASEEVGASIRGQASGGDIQVRDVDRFEIVIQERTRQPRSGTFIRTNDLHGSPAKADATIAFARDQVLPVLKAQPGFIANLVAVNRDTGRVLASSVWETAEAREASEVAVEEVRREAARLAGASTVNVELYESAYVSIKLPAAA